MTRTRHMQASTRHANAPARGSRAFARHTDAFTRHANASACHAIAFTREVRASTRHTTAFAHVVKASTRHESAVKPEGEHPERDVIDPARHTVAFLRDTTPSTRRSTVPACEMTACVGHPIVFASPTTAFAGAARMSTRRSSPIACDVAGSARDTITVTCHMTAFRRHAIALTWPARDAAGLAHACARLVCAITRRVGAITAFGRTLATALRALPRVPTGSVLLVAVTAPHTRAAIAMTTLDMKRMPALIARARREAGVEQQALARAIPVSLRTLSRWENGKHYPGESQARELAVALSNASGETWRALVDALGLPLEEMLEECPEHRVAEVGSAAQGKAAGGPPNVASAEGGARSDAAVVAVGAAPPPAPVPVVPSATVRAEIDLQDIVDDLIRAYAEEADVSPRRLRLALGLLLGELRLLGVGLDEAYGLVMRAPWRRR